MINQSRLSQVNSIANSRSGKDELKSMDKLGTVFETGLDPNSTGSLLSGNSPQVGGAPLAGTNSFSQLLEMSQLDKSDSQKQSKLNRTDKQSTEDVRPQNEARKKSKGDETENRKSVKARDKKSNNSGEDDLTLSQLLLAQQKALNPENGKSALTQQAAAPESHAVKMNQGKSDLMGGNNIAAVGELNSRQLDNSSASTQDTTSVADALKRLDSKLDHLSALENGTHSELQNSKSDKLNEIASNFDDVKIEMSPTENNMNNGAKALESRELIRQMADREWRQNDLALRELAAQQSLNELALEKMGLDRLDQLSQLKNSQMDKLQLQDLQSAAALKQMQNREATAAAQTQWQPYRDLSPEQKAIVDALSNGQQLQGINQSGNNTMNSVNDRGILNQRLQNSTMANPSQSVMTQDAVAGLQSMPGSFGEAAGQSQSQSNNSSGSSQGESGTVGGITASRSEQSKSRLNDTGASEKAEVRTRESDRTREMARSAALRAQSIASELAAKGGGTAKVQIKDSKLGVVELRINMGDNNRVSVELVANSERVRNELEKQTDELKVGLEKHKVVLEGIHFSTDTKLGDSSFQNSSQNDNSKTNQQQQQQNFSSFSQNSGGSTQQNFSGGERFFEGPRAPLTNNIPTQSGVRKNYAGKNDAQTNVQRAANGSLKVTA